MKNIINKRASVLIVALWLLTIFAMLVLALGYRSRLEVKLLKFEKERFRAEQTLLSGINIAKYYLRQDSKPTVDSVFDKWYNQLEISQDVWPSQNLSLSVVDEDSKININQANEKVLTELFENIESEGFDFSLSHDDLVASILEWRGDSASKGTGAFSLEMKQAPFESLYELFLLEGVSRADYKELSKYLTVYKNDINTLKVNINTASEVVLKAIIAGLVGDERRKDSFFDKIIGFRETVKEFSASESGGKKYFVADDLNPYQFLELINLSSDVINVSLAIQLVKSCTVDSKFFNIDIIVFDDESESIAKAKVILGEEINQGIIGESNDKLKVLFWHEE